MLTKRNKFILTIVIVFTLIIVSNSSAIATTIDPAAEIQNLLGDPEVYVATVEQKAFFALAQIIAQMTSIMVLVFFVRAIFPK